MYLIWIFYHDFYCQLLHTAWFKHVPWVLLDPLTCTKSSVRGLFIGFLPLRKTNEVSVRGGGLTVNWLVISHDFISQLSHWYKPVTFHRNSCSGYDTGFYFSLLTPLNTLCTCKSELMDLSSSSFSGSWPHQVQPRLSSTPHEWFDPFNEPEILFTNIIFNVFKR